MFMVIRKLSRLVSTNLPRSSFLSEKPMAWTTKSIVGQRCGQARRRGRAPPCRNVAFDQEIAAQAFRQRPHPLFQRLALIGESQFGAVLAQALGNAPGQRLVVGEAHDQAALALHQPAHSASIHSFASGAAIVHLSSMSALRVDRQRRVQARRRQPTLGQPARKRKARSSPRQGCRRSDRK
jgi:hypothetical protein